MGFTARENQNEGKGKGWTATSKNTDKAGFPKVPADQKDKDDLGYFTKAKK